VYQTFNLETIIMALRLNIAASRKIGEPNFGSRGATVGLELEVDASLVEQPRQLHERIRRLFRLARQSVDFELGRTAGEAASDRAPDTRLATDRQIHAIYAIAQRRGLNLAAELQARFEVERLEDLSVAEASQMISELVGSSNGAGHVAHAAT
jgi:hypothetical protein